MDFWIVPEDDEPHHVHGDCGVADCVIEEQGNCITCKSCQATLRLNLKSAPLILLGTIIKAGRTVREIVLSTLPEKPMLMLFVSAEDPVVLNELVDAAGSHDELSPTAFATAA